ALAESAKYEQERTEREARHAEALLAGGNGEEEGFRAGRSLLAAGRNSIAHVLLANYDNHHRPMKTPGAPTVVEINMYIQSFGSISVIDMDYTLDIMLRQKWVDPRLKFTGYQHTLSLSYLKQQIWIPDLFFRNSKYGFLHEITTPNYLIWLQFDGTITFSQKLTVKLSCPM
uniref:Neur_chan_LBD domain-containing protein n=1 Tax=Macrostomum lignano TaxID=282301 RepID=A0A1I8FGD2_9PLAT